MLFNGSMVYSTVSYNIHCVLVRERGKNQNNMLAEQNNHNQKSILLSSWGQTHHTETYWWGHNGYWNGRMAWETFDIKGPFMFGKQASLSPSLGWHKYYLGLDTIHTHTNNQNKLNPYGHMAVPHWESDTQNKQTFVVSNCQAVT